nr:hypothetical protein [Streptomyces corallincola]
MTHLAVLGSTSTDPVAYVRKAPRRGGTVAAAMPFRAGIQARCTA